MIDILRDIVKHTHGLGFLDLVKIAGTSDETTIDSMAEDRSVILQGSFHKPQSEMVGTFGMPQLNKLDIHLKCPEYKEKAKISVLKAQRNGAEVRQHSAEPTLVDIRHSATICGLANGVLGLLLRSDEEHVAAVGHEVTKEVVGRVDAIQRLVEINDVNSVALTEDEAAHFWVPASGLVAEVRTCLNHLTHADESHESLLCGLRLGSRQGAETTANDGNMLCLE